MKLFGSVFTMVFAMTALAANAEDSSAVAHLDQMKEVSGILVKTAVNDSSAASEFKMLTTKPSELDDASQLWDKAIAVKGFGEVTKSSETSDSSTRCSYSYGYSYSSYVYTWTFTYVYSYVWYTPYYVYRYYPRYSFYYY